MNENYPLEKLGMSAKIYDSAVAIYKPFVKVALVSGGDDSIAAIEVLRKVGKVDYVVHVDTTCGIKKTTEFVYEYCNKEKLNLFVVKSPEETFENNVLEYGFPGPAQHGRMYIRLKERALRVAQRKFQLEGSFCRLKGWDSPHKASNKSIPLEYHPRFPDNENLIRVKPERTIMFFTGARREESTRRMGTVEDIKKEGNQIWVNIIADWTGNDIYHFRQAEKYMRSPVSAALGRSGECNCGSFGYPEELQEMIALFPNDENVRMIVRLEKECKAKGLKFCRYGHGQKNELMSEENPVNQNLCSTCINNHKSIGILSPIHSKQ
jgi:3'-phosphoadenosine 5'-phosphosulfate sulfotransferase (PAPS reductase)/FAD synthetase